jgi:hypothetical protein
MPTSEASVTPRIGDHHLVAHTRLQNLKTGLLHVLSDLLPVLAGPLSAARSYFKTDEETQLRLTRYRKLEALEICLGENPILSEMVFVNKGIAEAKAKLSEVSAKLEEAKKETAKVRETANQYVKDVQNW